MGLVAAWGALSLGGCAAPMGEAGVRTVRSATPAGTAVRVASFARWNERCEAAGLPAAAVTLEPLHGTLKVTEAVLTAGGRLYGGGTNCRDRKIAGVELWYAPTAGFRGTDRMRYEVDAGEGAVRFLATVDVR